MNAGHSPLPPLLLLWTDLPLTATPFITWGPAAPAQDVPISGLSSSHLQSPFCCRLAQAPGLGCGIFGGRSSGATGGGGSSAGTLLQRQSLLSHASAPLPAGVFVPGGGFSSAVSGPVPGCGEFGSSPVIALVLGRSLSRTGWRLNVADTASCC